MESNKALNGPEDKELIIAARTWFCLYLFEHQWVFFSYFETPRCLIVCKIGCHTVPADLLS
jgi:hypothetical protein